MNYKDQNKIAGETEDLSSDEQNVARLLSDLKRVDAPKDFDFHLKARIANASPGDHKPARFLPVLRYALPLVLVLVAGGAFMLNSSYSGAGDVPVVADVSNAPVPAAGINTKTEPSKVIEPVVESVPGDIRVAGTVNTQSGRHESTLAVKGSRRPLSSGTNSQSNSNGGSYDSALESGNTPRSARFSNTNGSKSNSSENPEGILKQPLQLREMLRTLGIIEADQEEKGWRVRTLTKNGVAEQAGLQTGDLMEAIDDKPISTLYDGNFGATSISVRRGGELRKIEVKPKNP